MVIVSCDMEILGRLAAGNVQFPGAGEVRRRRVGRRRVLREGDRGECENQRQR